MCKIISYKLFIFCNVSNYFKLQFSGADVYMKVLYYYMKIYPWVIEFVVTGNYIVKENDQIPHNVKVILLYIVTIWNYVLIISNISNISCNT